MLNIRKTEGDIIYKCGMLWKQFINNVFQPGPTSPTQLWPHLSSLSLLFEMKIPYCFYVDPNESHISSLENISNNRGAYLVLSDIFLNSVPKR